MYTWLLIAVISAGAVSAFSSHSGALERDKAPEWLSSFGANPFRPATRYLTGFGMSSNTGQQTTADKLAHARDLAIGNLVATVRARVSVKTVSGMRTGDGVQKGRISDHYHLHVTSSSDAHIEGIRTETFYSQRRKVAYAFAWLDRKEAHQRYRSRIERKLSTLRELSKQATRATQQSETVQTRGLYQECLHLIGEVDKAVGVIELLGYREALSESELSFLSMLKARARLPFRADSASWKSPALRATAWTNHGADSLHLQDGESIVVYVRSNKPVHVRFFYQLSEGSTILPDMMYANYYIGSDQVNQAVALPDTFSVSAPYGTERMHFQFSATPFEPVAISMRNIAGQAYHVVLSDNTSGEVEYRGLTKGAGSTASRVSETIHVKVSPRT